MQILGGDTQGSPKGTAYGIVELRCQRQKVDGSEQEEKQKTGDEECQKSKCQQLTFSKIEKVRTADRGYRGNEKKEKRGFGESVPENIPWSDSLLRP